MSEITNWYLYKQKNFPTENERIDPAKVISEKEKTIYIDVNTFMNKQNGPGRFITAADFSFVGAFLNPNAYLFDEKNPYQNYYSQELIQKLINLPKGVPYKKKDILDILQYGSAEQTLGLYDDGQDDVLERAYIWNTTAFKISEDAVFVVDKEGNRYIENFAIVPHSNRPHKEGENEESKKYGAEDFDFEGGFFSEIVNSYLRRNIDPSGIGKTVEIIFTGKRNVEKPFFTYEDFVKEQEKQKRGNLLTGLETGERTLGGELIKRLWDSGSIQHLYQGKPIIYGTDKEDKLVGTITDKGVAIGTVDEVSNAFGQPAVDPRHPLRIYVKNGIVYVTGNGNDTITGTNYADIMLGGSGNDTYYSGNGDEIHDEDGSGRIYLKRSDSEEYDRIGGGMLVKTEGDKAWFVLLDTATNQPKFIYEAEGYRGVEYGWDLLFHADKLKVTRVSDGHQITIKDIRGGELGMDFWRRDYSGLNYILDALNSAWSIFGINFGSVTEPKLPDHSFYRNGRKAETE